MLDFEYIKNHEPITIVGHMNGDCDSFISCVLMSKFFDYKGISNKKKMLDNVFDEHVEFLGINKEDFEIGITDEEPIFMVDSSLKLSNTIVGCIDHHVDEPNTEINYINKKSTSCAKIIYDLMLKDGYNFSVDEIKMVVFSLFMDSCSFKSSKALETDHDWAKDIIGEYSLDYNFFYDKGLCLNDLSNPKEFCFYGTKKYKKDNLTYYSSYIQVKEDSTEDFDKACIETIRNKMIEDGISLWVFLVQNVYEDRTKYIIIEEGSYITHIENRLLSRGNDVIPRVEYEVFNMRSKIFIDSSYSFIIKELINKNASISTMESCTSGLIASTITDTENASKILKGAFVTYSNEAKVLQGVSKDIIDTFGVYSYETAIEMANACSKTYNSLIGIGITGTTGNVDENNSDSVLGEIYFTIRVDDKIFNTKLVLDTTNMDRVKIKKGIIYNVFSYLGMLSKFYI